MKRIFNLNSVVVFLSLVFVIATSDIIAQRRRPVLHRHRKPVAHRVVKPAEPQYALAAGTTLHVRMNRSISSKTARAGETFTATVTEPVYSTNGVVVIPSGSTVLGHIDTVKPALKGGKPGEISCSFTQVRLPNGRSRTINGSLTDLDNAGVKSDNEGTVTAGTMQHRKLIFIGGGGVGGAIIGGAIGGGKGALIGGILGAAGGFAGDHFTKGKDAEVKSGTEFGVYLNRAVSLPRFVEVTPVTP